MRKPLQTYYLRKLINTLVDASLTSPSLAEMVHHHLQVEWIRGRRLSQYRIFDSREVYWELSVIDAHGYTDLLYQQGLALLAIAVNGALVAPSDEERAKQLFPSRAFRTCPYCGQRFHSWLDYYGHYQLDHLLEHQRRKAI
ncbi:MAG: hypothetical protein C7B43_05700 [Sulfobacillus benefaciens]|jgi:hypothetical protein|uniref:C2H2-type domain-containing protein n=1 Tax=Sulfobacillus benefaciens TaxID=453960 RepID=A0A2T2X7V3_9FIRM|nr:MAG: hypothetical protein C7B43_05700 [Sulfobacillus benefaciens]HBQ93862.1 hypothetical protein [Sulfobacillus sp.]